MRRQPLLIYKPRLLNNKVGPPATCSPQSAEELQGQARAGAFWSKKTREPPPLLVLYLIRPIQSLPELDIFLSGGGWSGKIFISIFPLSRESVAFCRHNGAWEQFWLQENGEGAVWEFRGGTASQREPRLAQRPHPCPGPKYKNTNQGSPTMPWH